MKLQSRINIFLFTTLSVMTVLTIVIGTVMIGRITLNLNQQLLVFEVNGIVKEVDDAYHVLKIAGIITSPDYVRKAKQQLVERFMKRRFNMESANLFIFTREGKVVYHRDFEPGMPFHVEFIKTMLSAEQGIMEYQYDRSDRFCVFRSFPEWEWIIALSVDRDELFKNLIQYIFRVTIIAVVLLSAALLIAKYMAAKFARRIETTLSCLKSVEQGDLTVRIDSVSSDDEVGILQHSINSMISNLESIIEQKEAASAELLQTNKKLISTNELLQKEIFERKKAESDLNAFTRKLEQSNGELEQFAYIASHDLQEPLRKVTAFGDRLKDKYAGSLGDQGKDYLERMQSAAVRMQTLINGLLTFSRVTTKAQPFEPVDLGRITEEVLSDLEVRIEQTQAKVEVGELPTIDADPLQMRQLFQNLLGNALKFYKPGEPPVVKVYGETPDTQSRNRIPSFDGTCRITVEDKGIGFDEKYTDRIFGVFQRLHGKSEYEGTGIGLSVCRKIVERHGGNIEVKSRPGEGTQFMIMLPVNQTGEAGT